MTYEVLRALKKRGLLERSQKEGDKRSKFSELTDAGVSKIQGAAKDLLKAEESFFKSLGENKQGDFVLPEILEANQKAFDIVPKIQEALSFARANHWPVFYIVREYRDNASDVEKIRIEDFKARKRAVPGTFGCEIVEALKPEQGEYRVVKWRFSGFMHTELDLLLRRLLVQHVVVCGTQLPNCVRATVYDAVTLDYYVTVIKDAVAARTDEVHRANIVDIENLGVKCKTWAEFVKDNGVDNKVMAKL